MAMVMEATSRPATEITEVIDLEAGASYCLPYGVSALYILNGVAWITMQTEDQILKCGADLTIPRQPHAVIVSAAHHQRLRFELRRQ